MAVLLTCPNGHRWEFDGKGSSACPRCGGAARPASKPETVAANPATPSPARSPAPAAADLPEQFGRYRVLKQLGKGGMGAVYLAHDTQLDRPVALKVPHFSASDGPHVLERFQREARAAATLRHSNICPVYDVGEIDGVRYLTMAFIEGRPLSSLIGDDKPLTVRQAATLVRKLALALKEAHGTGVIHRDLKPSNIMIDKRGEPVLMDFGLARRIDQTDKRLTQSGAILGTPAYMSPEQVSGDLEALGPASDIYSLGVILYELLIARLPFEGPTAAVLGQIMVSEPPPPSKLRPDLDSRVESICLKAMAKKIEGRYASMGELAAALTEYLQSKGQPPTPAPAPKAAPDDASGFRVSRMGGLRSVAQLGRELDIPKATPAFATPRKRKRTARRAGIPPWVWVTGGVSVAGLIVLAIVLLSGPSSDGVKTEPPAGVAKGPTRRTDINEAAPAPKKADQPAPASEPNTPATQPEPSSKPAADFQPLFNGRDLTGWMTANGGPPDPRWSVREGTILCSPGDRIGLWTKARFSDFQLELEYRTSANSGVFFWADTPADRMPDRLTHTLEVEIDKPTGAPDIHGCGALWGVAAPRRVVARANDWNSLSITARGSQVAVAMNGESLLAVDLDQWTEAGKNPDGTANPYQVPVKNMKREGHIGLQAPNGTIEFRAVRIKELTSTAAKTPAAEPKSSRGVAYADTKHERQTLDVYATTGGKSLPVVVWIHGGGWQQGNKSEVEKKPQAFVDRGFVFVSINYRLLPEATIKQMAGDVAKAIRWVHDHANEYGGDPDTILVMGHSAGAQLAALVCTDDRYLRAEGLPLSTIKACVPVDGDTYDVPMQIRTVAERIAGDLQDEIRR